MSGMAEKRAFVAALEQRACEYSAALERLGELADEVEAYELTCQLREAVELVRCLRRLVSGLNVQEIHRAFGAPGDFGYQTPIGAALARLYAPRGEP